LIFEKSGKILRPVFDIVLEEYAHVQRERERERERETSIMNVIRQSGICILSFHL